MAETGSGLLPLGATIAITVGCAAVVLAIMIICFCHFYLRKKRKMKTVQARELPLLLYGNRIKDVSFRRKQNDIYTSAPAADRLSQVLYAHTYKANTHARQEMPPFAAFNDDVKPTSYTYPDSPWNANKAAQKDWGKHSFVTQPTDDGQTRLYDIPKKPRPVWNSTNPTKLPVITSKYDSSGSRLAVDLGITEGTHSPKVWTSVDDRPPMRLPSYAHKHDSFRDSQGADLGLGSYAASSLWL